MNKLTCSAIALSMTCATGFASDSEWSALDQEVGALASTLSMDGGASLTGALRGQYASSDSLDLGGFIVGQARVAVSGSKGSYGYHVDYDFASGGALRDAYATFGIGGSVTAKMGQFRASVCSDADKDENEMDHFSHSAIGGAYSAFTEGLGLSGEQGAFSWAVSAMNGLDGTGDEIATVFRVGMTVVDGGEGDISVNAGVAIVDEGGDTGLSFDLGGTIMEVHASNGTWSLGLEIMDTDDLAGVVFNNGISVPLIGEGKPMVISGSFKFMETWTLALRTTDYDFDAVGLEQMEATATNTLTENVSWQFGHREMSADLPGSDVSATLVGLNITF